MADAGDQVGGVEAVVAALVLAAGGGPRYGGPKALLRTGGQLLVDRALTAAREAGCAPILVVLGSEAARVRTEAALDGALVVENPGWRSGTGSSMRAGFAALERQGDEVTAVVLLLAETPGVTAEAVRRVAEGADEQALRAATYGGRRGYPVLVGRRHWSGMGTLAGTDVGARAYLTARADQVVAVGCEDVADGAEYEVPALP
jgi:CTP:molybdopterin cytidylyltransferase MocA